MNYYDEIRNELWWRRYSIVNLDSVHIYLNREAFCKIMNEVRLSVSPNHEVIASRTIYGFPFFVVSEDDHPDWVIVDVKMRKGLKQ